MWGRYHVGMALAALALGLVALGVDVVRDRAALRSPATGSGRDAGVAGGARGGPGVPGHPLGAVAWPLVLVSLAGVWASVPDTEPPLVLGAALTPLALRRWWLTRPPSPPVTALLVAGIVGAALAGSAGRPAAAMAWCAVGAVLVAPAIVGFRRRWPTPAATVPVGATHTVVALAGCRLLMVQTGAAVAVVAAGCLGAVALAVFLTRAGTVAA